MKTTPYTKSAKKRLLAVLLFFVLSVCDGTILSCESITGVAVVGASSYTVGEVISITADVSPSVATPSSYQWYKDGSAIVGATDKTFIKTAALTDAGSYTVKVSNPCSAEVISVAVVLEVCAIPVVTVTGGSRCGTGTVALSASTTTGTLSWYSSSTSTTALATGTSYTTPSLSATTTYYVEAVSGACKSGRTAVVATVNALPTVASTTPGSVCGTGTVTLSATASTGATIRWYSASTGGTALATATSYTTASISATTTYYAEAYNSTTGCVSSARTAVVATVNALPAAPSVTTPLDVASNTSFTLSATPPTGCTTVWYSTAASTTVLATGNTYTISAGRAAGTYSYYAASRNTATGCESSTRAVVAVTAINCTKITSATVESCVPYMFTYQTMTLTATQGDGTEATSYQWYVNGVAVSGATSDTYAYSPGSSSMTTDKLGNQTKTAKVYCVVGNICSTVTSNTYEVLVVYAQLGTLSPIMVNQVDANGTVSSTSIKFAHVNLGAESELDPCNIIGDLYQWGRAADGHQKRNSVTTATLATSNTPGHANFIINTASPYDWRSGGGNDSRWGDGTTNANPAKAANDPCPTGWKVPSQAQWQSIFHATANGVAPGTATANTWTWATNGYRVNTALFLPAGGIRVITGSLSGVGSTGFYWSSTVVNTASYTLNFLSSTVSPAATYSRVVGMSVRCVSE
jgi:uncharacterized protein (TIGR02145 family)